MNKIDKEYGEIESNLYEIITSQVKLWWLVLILFNCGEINNYY